LSPVLALVAGFILVTQWIATNQRRQIHQVASGRASRTNPKADPSPWLDEADQVTAPILSSARSSAARLN
jgi:hypothetical protein